MSNKPLPLDMNYVIREYRAGRTGTDIARELGVSLSLIMKRLKAAGVSSRGNRTTADEGAVAAAYAAGESSDSIAERFGISKGTVTRIVRRNGGQVRPSAFEPRVSVDMKRARYLYESGIGLAAVASQLNVSPTALARIFRDEGIATRDRSGQQQARMSRASPEERKRLVKKAHKAVRGRTHSFEEKSQRAVTNQSRPHRISPYERELAAMLLDRGITTEPQTPVGPYNCDLTIHPVAVEVWGGNWHFSGDHFARSEERFRYIMDCGWHVLVLVVERRRFPLTPAVADYLVSEIQRLRSNPASWREYRVVWGAGELTTGGRSDDAHFSIEPPFTNARDPATGRYQRVPR